MAGNYIGAYSPQPTSANSGGGAWGGITGTITDQTDLVDYIDDELLPIADKTFTQPSASTTWVLDHGRSIKPNLAYWNATGEREYPDEIQTGATELTITFGTSEIHTATLPGNGTSASLRNDSILELLASEVNAASGVIDIATAKNVVITMDANITDLTFVGTPVDTTELVIKFIKGATLYTCTLDVTKFQGSATTVLPSPLLLATINTEDTFSFKYSATKTKMSCVGFDLGA